MRRGLRLWGESVMQLGVLPGSELSADLVDELERLERVLVDDPLDDPRDTLQHEVDQHGHTSL